MGGQWCEWLEAFWCHGPGPILGSPYRLHGDAELFVWQLGEVFPAGHRRAGELAYREAALVEPKVWAKSELASGLCGVKALGPAVFDGWDADGNPVGRPVEYANVQVFANDEDQAGNTFRPTVYGLHPKTARPELLDEYGEPDAGIEPDTCSRIVLPGQRGVIEPLSSRARSKEGRLPTFLVLEEPHLWVLRTMVELWRTGIRGVLKTAGYTQALLPSNWFVPGEGSVLEQVWLDVEAGAEGVLWCGNALPAGILDPSRPVRDQPKAAIRKALLAVYGTAAAHAGIEALIDYIRRPSTRDEDVWRFYLNAGRTLASSWTDHRSWMDRMAAPGVRLAAKDRIGLGFVGVDGCVALVGCRLKDRLVEPVAVWDGRTPEPSEVEAAVRDAFERFTVARMLVNPWGWMTELERWATRYGEKVVLRFPVREDARMEVVLDRWDTAVHTGQLSHVGDETLSKHVLACSTRKDARTGNVRNLVPKSPELSIVVAQAAVLAHEAACLGLADGAAEKPKPVGGPSAAALASVAQNPLRSHGRLKI